MIHSITGALARKRSSLTEKEKGFTLIELLVVVIIIGILAAVAIPIFLGQQDQAKDAGVKSDLANAKVAYVSQLVDAPGAIPDLVALQGKGFVQTYPAVTPTITAASATAASTFCIAMTSPSSGTPSFAITNRDGVKKGSCTTTGLFTTP
ncbi:type IV pilus assembly protein PilA [Cryobacterium sp. CAN_C3]|uniref:type IV pilin protein n=1 Tax=unclassified Cryobacterium TaxID=2649013 RepID=UPI0018C9984B|nr:prepilin-type N-terminal cleavage/methylation domain-containing protein [Cryobacterium sp. CAN_C3]MEC5153399.1 type IV pilus assembly protein PilA [Cryobacterium sp. CAN_C3]